MDLDYWADWGTAAGYGDTFQELDLDVASTTIKKGNFNYFDNAIPAAESLGGLSWPDSLYLSSKPAWFGNLMWPPFNPLSHNPTLDAIPAGYRYVHGTDAPGVVDGGTPTPINGSCSATLNTCIAGTFSDVADTAANYLWSCTGSNDGTTALAKTPLSISGAQMANTEMAPAQGTGA